MKLGIPGRTGVLLSTQPVRWGGRPVTSEQRAETQTGEGATMGVMGSFDSLGRIVGPVLAGWQASESLTNFTYPVPVSTP